MKNTTILEIETKENKVEVTIFLHNKNIEETTKEIQIPQTKAKKAIKKNYVIKKLLTVAFKQIYTPKPKNTKVFFTQSALEKMGAYGLSEAKVEDAVLHGEYVEGKDSMISRKYNGYEIGAIAKYNKVTKTYVVLSAWKRNRR
jgi:hypothetical protein